MNSLQRKQQRKEKRLKQKEIKEFDEYCQIQREQYKKGFLSQSQISTLEGISGWVWDTPLNLDIKAIRNYINGKSEELTIASIEPYGLPNQYEIIVNVDVSKVNGQKRPPSTIMIIKDNKIVSSFEAADQCINPQCDCTELTMTAIII